MFTQKVAVVAVSALTLVSASTSNWTITPASVQLTTRASWCTSETNVCSDICSGSTTDNSCDPSTLIFGCTCSDGTSPDLNEYANSLPYFECIQTFDNCISANVGSATGQANCTTNIRNECGSKNATAAASTTSTAASSTGSATGTAASASKGSATSTSSSKAGSMPTGIQQLSNGAVAVAGLLALAL